MSFRFARPATLTAFLASALVSLAGVTARADLLYVTLGNNRVVTYDG